MHPGAQAKVRSDLPVFIMASRREAVTYAEPKRRTNRLADPSGLDAVVLTGINWGDRKTRIA